MMASIEISMYPLRADYLAPIQDFIDRLHNHHNITVRTNSLSTQIFGELPVLMDLLKNEIAASFAQEGQQIFVLKILNGNHQ